MLKKWACLGSTLLLILSLWVSAFSAAEMGRGTAPGLEGGQGRTALVGNVGRLAPEDQSLGGAELPSLETMASVPGREEERKWAPYVSCQTGEQVSFMTTVTVSENLTDYNSYYCALTVELDPGLRYVDASARITMDRANGKDLSEHFTVFHKNGTLTVFCKDLLAIEGIVPQQRLVLCYDATLTSEAIMGNPGNLCSAKLEYSDPATKGEGGKNALVSGPCAYAAVFTYGLRINKVDGNTFMPVTNAEFMIRNEDNKYLILQDGMVEGWTGDPRKGSVLTSDGEGMLSVMGIRPGLYSLEEIKAAQGYQGLDEPISIEIFAYYDAGEDGRSRVSRLQASIDGGEIYAAPGETLDLLDLRVENAYRPELPQSGGVGTSLFYILGGTAMFAVALVCVAKRKGQKNEVSPAEE